MIVFRTHSGKGEAESSSQISRYVEGDHTLVTRASFAGTFNARPFVSTTKAPLRMMWLTVTGSPTATSCHGSSLVADGTQHGEHPELDD